MRCSRLLKSRRPDAAMRPAAIGGVGRLCGSQQGMLDDESRSACTAAVGFKMAVKRALVGGHTSAGGRDGLIVESAQDA